MAIQASSTSTLEAIAGRSVEKAEGFAQKHNIAKSYGTYDALLADTDIDAIYIGLPNHLHKEWIMRAAVAGKHILCEKPFVTSLEEAQEAFAVVKKANVFCLEALMYRHHPVTLKLIELIKNKALGEIKRFNAIYTADIAALANTTAGGSILNLGCYPVSLIRLLAGSAHNRMTAEPSDLVSIGEMDKNRNVDRSASLLMQFPKQMTATVTVTDDMDMFTQFEVFGTEGMLTMLTNPWMPEQTDNKILIKRHDQAESAEIIITADKPLYTYQIDAVAEGILQGSRMADDTDVSWLESLGNTIVLEAWLNQVKAKTTEHQH
ncbi:MAG: Gfo/Idh/MocA family oxidoreductase [Gammaproteobacteria bacterium]